MKLDLSTLDGQRKAMRRGLYVMLGITAVCIWLALRPYPEEQLLGAACACIFGPMLVPAISMLRLMARKQRWVDAGSIGSFPTPSGLGQWAGPSAVFVGFGCAGVLMFLSGYLYRHWHHVSIWQTPARAMALGFVIAAGSLAGVFGWILPGVYKTCRDKA